MIEQLIGKDGERVMEVLSTVEDNRKAGRMLGLPVCAVMHLKTNLDLVYRELILWKKKPLPALRLIQSEAA